MNENETWVQQSRAEDKFLKSNVRKPRSKVVHCCEILKYSQVYKPCRSIVGQERGRTHRDLNERRKIKSNLNQINPNLV